ncbi:MAG: putative baseplate assembly protein [Herpetosiphonaceae bacterium]|nr:putative baseplate assembly protein [Herpetosiphonaceae bacterium]
MMKSATICNDEQRRRKVREQTNYRASNGIDYIEVRHPEEGNPSQVFLDVHLFEPAPSSLNEDNIQITGGRRVRDIRVTELRLGTCNDQEQPDCMQIRVDKEGDFSTYTLSLVEKEGVYNPADDFDTRYMAADFSFKVDCPSDLDCQTEDTCPPPTFAEPEINYLAKDYASFRQLILDRLALVMPDWHERHAADLGITLVELLAYVGDYLSYYQDAVATEAYLNTARQRISVRRHVRLIDYQMHEGCNARTWLVLQMAQDDELALDGLGFITDVHQVFGGGNVLLQSADLRSVPTNQYEWFEPVQFELGQTGKVPLWISHNEIHFYTWGDQECCLPKGATSATLYDGHAAPPATEGPHNPYGNPAPSPAQDTYGGSPPPPAAVRQLHLKEGDILIFEEVIGPHTGMSADADPTQRHAVRLTEVKEDIDHLYNQPLVEVKWAVQDALPFPLCLSTRGPAPQCELLEHISVARGNVLLVDHGRTIKQEVLGAVQADAGELSCEQFICGETAVDVPRRFRPALQSAPLTFSSPLPSAAADHHQAAELPSATALLAQDVRQSLPQITLLSSVLQLSVTPSQVPQPAPAPSALAEGSEEHHHHHHHHHIDPVPDPQPPQLQWLPRLDLLASQPSDLHYVVEMNDDGHALLRFGDGLLGHLPQAHTEFTATYRVGNGPMGNIGAGAITHVVAENRPAGITRMWNPLAARGGTAPEPLSEVKLFAPGAFRKQLERAITPEDYAQLVQTYFPDEVQQAVAAARWTGSWYRIVIAVDPRGSEDADPALLAAIKQKLMLYRRIGHDIEVVGAGYLPLDITVNICVLPHYLRGHVEAALLDRLGNRLLPNGQTGYFHPDNLTFGDSIPLSTLVAAAQAIPGVDHVVQVTIMARNQSYQWPASSPAVPDDATSFSPIIPVGPLEIARMDNDPSLPENGTLKLVVRGGR